MCKRANFSFGNQSMTNSENIKKYFVFLWKKPVLIVIALLILPPMVLITMIVIGIWNDSYYYADGPIEMENFVGTWRIQKPSYKADIFSGWQQAQMVLHIDGTCDFIDFPENLKPRDAKGNLLPGFGKQFSGTWTVRQRKLCQRWDISQCVSEREEKPYDDYAWGIVDRGPPYRLAIMMGPESFDRYMVWKKTGEYN